MRVYKFYRADYARQAILKQRLKLTTLNDVNDPFELRAVSSGDQRIRLELERWRQEKSRELAFISFSRGRKNPVVWSHYADNYRGVCLGFQVDDKYLAEIEYTQSRLMFPRYDLKERMASSDWRKRIFPFVTKFAHWQYEDELRAFHELGGADVIHDNGLCFQPFGDTFTLKEIILGPGYQPVKNADERKEIMDAVAQFEGCSTKTARLAFNEFEVAIQHERSRQKQI
ncbi:hypothetical protein U879_03935 [Defluviimonas sp. 20V17]|uniref:DUF2971 domain-containing protein n=1 Tax=Allgaiera indica TaxID=765699 RepID=A0AAN5A123_9RHOB|nr:DUF2971 domain-containing protein [Allgaiera indica]KDB04981.1 hypothetical protein U879_03935 [Defluviimonas sp. 20V17]GHE05432.1 hypothetical protein GCM10008024_36130 [Allgaiera indica]SDX72228.1 Protein of unknown function [Allgaiera indica]